MPGRTASRSRRSQTASTLSRSTMGPTTAWPSSPSRLARRPSRRCTPPFKASFASSLTWTRSSRYARTTRGGGGKGRGGTNRGHSPPPLSHAARATRTRSSGRTLHRPCSRWRLTSPKCPLVRPRPKPGPWAWRYVARRLLAVRNHRNRTWACSGKLSRRQLLDAYTVLTELQETIKDTSNSTRALSRFVEGARGLRLTCAVAQDACEADRCDARARPLPLHPPLPPRGAQHRIGSTRWCRTILACSAHR